MPLSPAARRVGQLTFVAVLFAAGTLAIRHSNLERKTSPPAPALAETKATPQSKAVAPTIQPTAISLDATPFDPNDSVAFTTTASSVIAEFHDGITLEQWTKSQTQIDDWKPSKAETFFDCRTFVKTETLPSGRQIKHLVFFYPPESPRQAIFPSASADDLLNHDCKLAMVRVQTSATTDRIGHTFEQAAQHDLVQKYGDSIGMKGTSYERSTAAARWMADSEIVAVYDPQPRRSDDDEDSNDPDVFVAARLPIVKQIDEQACCLMRDHYHAIEIEQFQRALGMAAADAALTDRVAALFRKLFRRVDLAPEPSDLDQSRAAVLPALAIG